MMFGLGLPPSLPCEVSHSGMGTKMSFAGYPWRMVDQWLGFTSRCGFVMNRGIGGERDHNTDLLRSGSGRGLSSSRIRGREPLTLSTVASRSGPYGGFVVSMHGTGKLVGGVVE
jgi:hypothetical protein